MDKTYPSRFAFQKSTILSPHIQGKNKTHGFLLHIAWCKTVCGTWLIENIREYIGLYARADPLVPSCHIHLLHPFVPIRSQHKSLQEYLRMLDFFANICANITEKKGSRPWILASHTPWIVLLSPALWSFWYFNWKEHDLKMLEDETDTESKENIITILVLFVHVPSSR